jgi:2-polyprenyl-3-methyl-5-hydroxy-6-metoxy-1,4-benzoquinol methylase
VNTLAKTALKILLRADDWLTLGINKLAIPYGRGVHVKHRLMKYHDFFVDRIHANERVLEIGCGYGAVAYSIASRAGATVTGIDRNAANIAKAKALFQRPNLTFFEGDALKDLPDGRWDVIVLSNVLEHLDRRVEFLRDVQRRVRPQRWLIRVPMFNRDWRVPLRKELGLPYFSDREHFTEYTQESFEEELKQAGLRAVHLQINWGEIWAEAHSNA